MSPLHLVIPLAVGLAIGLTHKDVAGQEGPKPLRAGIIGLDTSHVVAFTELLNGPKAVGALAGIRVVAAYPGGSPDVASSRDRVEGFTRQLRDQFGVEIVDSIEALLEKVDVVLLESVDGRPHLAQATPVLKRANRSLSTSPSPPPSPTRSGFSGSPRSTARPVSPARRCGSARRS